MFGKRVHIELLTNLPLTLSILRPLRPASEEGHKEIAAHTLQSSSGMLRFDVNLSPTQRSTILFSADLMSRRKDRLMAFRFGCLVSIDMQRIR
uniref:Uncharacterized protein n=1 Tax=Steinernema glaseri TaxID=37863 RepID=A0A1I7YCG6_9BILA